MMRHELRLGMALLMGGPAWAGETSLREPFTSPGADRATVPLWHLDGKLTKEEITRQLEDAKAAGFSGFATLPVSATLRAEGAFLVSAVRRDGRTQWVRVRSLAGEPCRIRPGLAGEVKSTVPMKPAGDGAYDLRLARGEEALLYVGERPPEPVVAPVDTDPKRHNAWGQRK